jgi:hypothetical protein
MPNILELMQLPQSQHGIRCGNPLSAIILEELKICLVLESIWVFQRVGREDLPSKVPPPLWYLAKTVSILLVACSNGQIERVRA